MTGNLGFDRDEQRHSRAILALGRSRLDRLRAIRVLVVGLDGVGAELAKNLVLSGLGAIDLHDTACCSAADLGTNIFVTAEELGRPRLGSAVDRLAALDPACRVTAWSDALPAELFSEFDAVVLANAGTDAETAHLGAAYLSARGPTGLLITVETRGLFARVRTGSTPAAAADPPNTAEWYGPRADIAAHLRLGFRALAGFEARHAGALPRRHHAGDAAELVSIAADLAPEDVDARLLAELAATAVDQLCPVVAFAAAVAAHQVLLLDDVDVRSGRALYFAGDHALVPDAAIGARLAALRVLLVGAGALGGEVLKNLALMGVAHTEVGGRVTLADPDTVARSNLGRQLLYRAHDVGEPKAAVAARQAASLRPEMAVTARALPVAPSTEATFDDALFAAHDVVIAAVDSHEARMYLDGRCVANARPLLEAGTLGQEASAQVVLPYVTEAYGSTQDPADSAIAVCTMRSHPTETAHVVAWARDELEKLDGEVTSFAECLAWARDRFDDWFRRDPEARLASSPEHRVAVVIPLRDDDAEHGAVIDAIARVVAARRGIEPPDAGPDDGLGDEARLLVLAANLRARCFGLPPAAWEEVLAMSGAILPALVTTTAMIAALQCLSLYRLAAAAPQAEGVRNWFVDLATARFVEVVPAPCARRTSDPLGARAFPEGWTLWDTIDIEARDLTLGEVLAAFTRATGLRVVSIAGGQSLLYAGFQSAPAESLAQPMVALVTERAPELLRRSRGRYADVVVLAEDPAEPAREIELPDRIRIWFTSAVGG